MQLTSQIRTIIEDALCDELNDGMISDNHYRLAMNWLDQFETDEEAL